ncbi:MAG: T9SS C-terminal target domain-containing protein [Calditrichaeota bacterium]|nr:MAG: T9SS C-terminal target domain-containing protein [Calditrichota bacterium]
MKVILLLLVILIGNVFGLPRNYFELEEAKKDKENPIIEYKTKSSEVFIILGLKKSVNGSATLYRSVKSFSPLVEWTALNLSQNTNFDFPVEEILISRNNNIFVKTSEGIFYSPNNGMSFGLSSLSELSQEKIDYFEVSSDFETPFPTLPSKYSNKINDLPPYEPTVWDTILWDTTQVFKTFNVTGFAGMHGKVAVDDSGTVHLFTLGEDKRLSYFRSDDYGTTFAPELVISDTMGGIYEVFTSGSYVHAYTITTSQSNPPEIRIYVSDDRGLTWNPKVPITYAVQSGFIARGDTLYDYQETGAGGNVYQSISYDEGMSFSPYDSIAGPLFSTIQRPSVAIGGNSIVYARTGNSTALGETAAYRSFDLGNSWTGEYDINPTGNNTDWPEVFFHTNTFHLTQGFTYIAYIKSENYGTSFTPNVTLCMMDSSCTAEIKQQLASHGNNVFPVWYDDQFWPGRRLITRFSRDNGETFSQHIQVSKYEPDLNGILINYGVAIDDSLVYTAYTDAKEVSPGLGELNLRFRRGFYKMPFFKSNNLELGIIDSSNTVSVDTNIVIKNIGNLPLTISQIDFPTNIASLNSLPFTIQPDSSVSLNLFFFPQMAGSYSQNIQFHTNQQVKSIQPVLVTAEIVTSSEENSNEIKDFHLSQNYPNPFNPSTTINYELQITNYEKAKLLIFNILGEEVKSWKLSSNSGEIVWNGVDKFGKPVSSGIYFYKLVSNKNSITKKMLLLK